MKIAAHSGHGIREAAGKKMEEWLFFNGVHIFGDEPISYVGV